MYIAITNKIGAFKENFTDGFPLYATFRIEDDTVIIEMYSNMVDGSVIIDSNCNRHIKNLENIDLYDIKYKLVNKTDTALYVFSQSLTHSLDYILLIIHDRENRYKEELGLHKDINNELTFTTSDIESHSIMNLAVHSWCDKKYNRN